MPNRGLDAGSSTEECSSLPPWLVPWTWGPFASPGAVPATRISTGRRRSPQPHRVASMPSRPRRLRSTLTSTWARAWTLTATATCTATTHLDARALGAQRLSGGGRQDGILSFQRLDAHPMRNRVPRPRLRIRCQVHRGVPFRLVRLVRVQNGYRALVRRVSKIRARRRRGGRASGPGAEQCGKAAPSDPRPWSRAPATPLCPSSCSLAGGSGSSRGWPAGIRFRRGTRCERRRLRLALHRYRRSPPR